MVVELPGGGRRHFLQFPALPGPISWDRISQGDRKVLKQLAKNARLVIEIGTFLGGSAECMFEAMPADGRMICVDTFKGTPANETAIVKPEDMLIYCVGRLKPYSNRLIVMVAESLAAAPMIADGIADLIFLDADHAYESVKADIRAWVPKLKPTGIFAGHDFYKCLEDLSEEEIAKKSLQQCDSETGIHWGIVRAVLESFTDVYLDGDGDSSIWHIKPEWRRND